MRPVKQLREAVLGRAESRDGALDGDGHVGTGILKNLFLESARRRIREHPGLLKSLEAGLPPLGEHA